MDIYFVFVYLQSAYLCLLALKSILIVGIFGENISFVSSPDPQCLLFNYHSSFPALLVRRFYNICRVCCPHKKPDEGCGLEEPRQDGADKNNR